MSRFAILCHSEYVADSMDWQLVITDHPFAEVQKGEVFTVSDLTDEINKAVGAGTAKPTGNTWSADLQRKNWPSRWITMRGARVLIKIMNAGKSDEHGIVVFAGNPKLEHLKVIPKGKEEYEEIKKEADKRKQKREDTSSYKPTEEDLNKERVQAKAKKEEVQEVEEGFKKKILDIVESSGKYEQDKIEQLRAALDGEDTNTSSLNDLADVAHNLTAPEQKQLAEDLIDHAHKAIVDDEIAKSFGDGYADVVNGIDPQTGEPSIRDIKSVQPEVKKILKSLKLSKEEALAILNADELRKQAKKDIRDKYKDDIVRPKGNLEVTSLQGIIQVDWDAEPPADELIEKVLGNEKARLRAQLNSEFYSKVQSDALGVDRYNKSTLVKNLDKGSMESVNTVSDIFLDGNGLPPELVELIGIENTGRVLAGAIAKKHGVKKAQKELEDIMETGAFTAVMDSLESINRRERTVADYEKQKDEGILRSQTLGAAIARQQVNIGRELGQTLGSLQTLASLVDSLRDVEHATGDIVVDAGKSYDKIQSLMDKIGISEDVYSLKKDSDRYRLSIPYEKFGELFGTESGSKERNERIAAIKAGNTFDPDWLPSGTPKTNYTVFDNDALEEKKAEWEKEGNAAKADGWEKFVNKKGEPGYSSIHKEGDVLYRKEGKTQLFKAPQKMIHMALAQKRYVANLGAGTGKTAGFLGLVQELKGSGKLTGFAFHTMPSRLRNEFFKDKDKFFPGLRVLELDSVKGGIEGKKKALEEASSGKYDMVVSGHDSMKSVVGGETLRKQLKQKFYAWREENKVGVMTAKEADKVKAENKEKWTEEITSASDLPAIIKSFKPQVFTVDEAHEAFKDLGATESNRFRAIKMLAEDAEYFVPATGTTIKNSMAELASLLHITAPDRVKNPKQWEKQWEGINQAPSVFGELSFDAFRRSYDDLMLTEHLSMPNIKRVRKEDRIELSKVQKEKIRQSEEIYHREKKMKGVALMKNDTYEIQEENGEARTFDISPKSLRNEDGTMTPYAISHLTKLGIDPKEYSLVALGQAGAAQRRDSRHAKTLANGDWKTNNRYKKIADNYEKHAQEGRKQIVFYNRKDSLESLKTMFSEKFGYTDNKDMLFIDGSVGMGRKGPGKGSDAQRDWKVKHFNQNPDAKVIFMSEAGMTGINMQAGSVTHWLERPNAHYKVVQGDARTDRTGQENSELAFYNYDTNTIMDDRRIDLLDKKRKLTEAVGETPDKRRDLVAHIVAAKKRLDERTDSILKKAMPRLYIGKSWVN